MSTKTTSTSEAFRHLGFSGHWPSTYKDGGAPGTVWIKVEGFGEPLWIRHVVDRLDHFWHQNINGDPETTPPALAVVFRVLNEAHRFMTPHTPTPNVVPTVEGGVQLVWHKGGWDVEVDIGSADTEVWALERTTGATFGGPLSEHVGRLQALLLRIGN